MAEEIAGTDAPPRGSGWLAGGMVVGLAVLVTAGVVGWARLGSGPATRGPAEPQPVEEAVPEVLAGGIELGELPDPVADAFDGPVVAARILDEAPPGADCDFLRHDFAEDPEVETVLITPDGAHVSLLGTMANVGLPGAEGAPQRMRATCTALWERDQWIDHGGGMAPADQPMGGASGSSCCDQDGLGTAEATVVVPEGAQWAVQDRGGYHLAYPASHSKVLPITWRFHGMRDGFGGGFGGGMASAARVTFVDDQGEVISEVTVGS